MKKTAPFILISSLLTGGALASVVVSGLAMRAGNGELATMGSRLALLFALGMVVYILPRLARIIRLDALRSDLSIKISAGGWIFLGLLAVAGLLALATANNLLYLIVAVLGATLVVSEIASRLSLSAVDVRLRFPDHIFARESARFEVTAHNRKRLLPCFSLAISASQDPQCDNPDDAPPPDKPAPDKSGLDKSDLDKSALDRLAYFPIIAPRAWAQSRFEFGFARRGVYPLRGFTISTRFPFGFIERRRHAAAAGEIIVYPQPRRFDERLKRLSLRLGRAQSSIKGSGHDLYSIRRYQPSDHPRHIDWKATAKTTHLMVREFTREDDARATVMLDVSQPAVLEAKEFGDLFERAVTAAASIVVYLLDEGAEVRLVAGDEDSGFGAGRAHCYRMLALLARVQPRPAAFPFESETAMRAASNRDDEICILLTPFDGGEIPARLRRSANLIRFDELAETAEDAEIRTLNTRKNAHD
ncbi:MAG: DUF58 domain-containing protein [Acidobacteria bacterium]|nr:DUF58 domain-containing protein [Acidobacteriota bacterium]MCW5969175.1 DUF58 domain-containing protein [Blastocatellales bacterium]